MACAGAPAFVVADLDFAAGLGTLFVDDAGDRAAGRTLERGAARLARVDASPQ
jgi:hypothetical protein